MKNAHAAAEAHSEVEILTENTEVKVVADQLFQTWEAAWSNSSGDVVRLD